MRKGLLHNVLQGWSDLTVFYFYRKTSMKTSRGNPNVWVLNCSMRLTVQEGAHHAGTEVPIVKRPKGKFVRVWS